MFTTPGSPGDVGAAAAEDGAVPVGALLGAYVVAQQFAGVADAEVERRLLEELVAHYAAQVCRMAVDVADGGVVHLDEAWAQPDAVAAEVLRVGEVHFQRQRVGVDVAFEVDVFERAEEARTAGGIAVDRRGEGRHVGLHEAHAHAVGQESDVEGLRCGTYGTFYVGVAAVPARHVGGEQHVLAVVVPGGAYLGVAEGAAVVAYVVDVQAFAGQHGRGAQQRAALEHTRGRAAYEGFVYLQGLEDGQQLDALYGHAQRGFFGRAEGTVDGQTLFAGLEDEVADGGGAVGPLHARGQDIPHVVAEVDGAGAEVDRGSHAAVGSEAQLGVEGQCAVQRYAAFDGPVDGGAHFVVGGGYVENGCHGAFLSGHVGRGVDAGAARVAVGGRIESRVVDDFVALLQVGASSRRLMAPSAQRMSPLISMGLIICTGSEKKRDSSSASAMVNS